MRFATKCDRWLVIVLAVGAVFTCAVLVLVPVPRLAFLLPLVIWAYVLGATLPRYYDPRPRACSTDRVLVVTTGSRRYIIAPADQPGFVDAVPVHATHLERRSFGLGLPFASPTVI